MSSLRRGVFAISLLAWAFLALPSSPARAEGADLTRLLAQAAGPVGADEAAAVVRGVSGGRILDVRLDGAARPPVYRVKVLLDGGRVRIYVVDAGSGRIVP